MPLLFDVWNLTTPFIHDAGLRQNERIFSDSQTISIIWALTTTICLGRGRLHLVIDQQEAQLSQRGRAMLLVIRYFAKTHKITQGHWKYHRLIHFLLAFYSNYGPILYHFRDKARYWSKIVIFATPHLHLTPLLRVVPLGLLS